MQQRMLQCGVDRVQGKSPGKPQQREMTMSHRLVKANLRSKLVIASMLGLLAGTGMAAAQVVDDPPGSQFQDQGIREDNGLAPFDYRAPRAGAYAYAPERNNHVTVQGRNHTRPLRGRADPRCRPC